MNAIHKALFNEARINLREWYGDNLASQGACLYWAQVTMRTLAGYGFRPVLQAGTMLWPVVPFDPEETQGATHFGYEWTPDEIFSRQAVAAGGLPEVHVWVALPDSREIVDFSTGYFKRLAIERHGIDWQTADPPEFIWGAPPVGVLYRPNVEAIKFVWRFILQKLGKPVPQTLEVMTA